MIQQEGESLRIKAAKRTLEERRNSFVRLMTSIGAVKISPKSDTHWQKDEFRIIAKAEYKSIIITKKMPKETKYAEQVLPVFRGYNVFGIDLDIDLIIFYSIGIFKHQKQKK